MEQVTQFPNNPKLRPVYIPLLSSDQWAVLHAAFPMSEEEWKQMMNVLQAMKRPLVNPQGEKEATP